MQRRHFLTLLGASAAGLALDAVPAFAGGPATPGPSPFGPLQAANGQGIRLPTGFTSRVVARAGSPLGSNGYKWPQFPDGGAVFPGQNGGWIYLANSEDFSAGKGGVSALHFGSTGRILRGNRVLKNTTANCSGGKTPWDTWLSCEEHPNGGVWECTPGGPSQGVKRPRLGRFSHEMVAVDPDDGKLYLTEDSLTGSGDEFYRFTPSNPLPDLTAGTLEVMRWNRTTGAITWVAVNPNVASHTRRQNGGPRGTAFDGNEGVWYHDGHVFFTAKVQDRVYDIDVAAQSMSVMWDADDYSSPILSGVDNLTMDKDANLYVAEDGGNMELVIISAAGRRVAPFLRVTGQAGSEITGIAFTPDGSRLYFSSQRGGANNRGITYEVKGPFPS
jgi:secreted PhoX family phosphatase